jgi:quercetin dioxygenase-like cupin family protein
MRLWAPFVPGVVWSATIRKRHRILKAIPHVQIDNEWVKVTQWCFAPGAETGYHVHEYDYVVVPLASGILRLEEPTGVREARLETGVSYARSHGVAHNVINANDYELSFLEIELIHRSAPR